MDRRPLWILTSHPHLYTPRRLVEEARRDGRRAGFFVPPPDGVPLAEPPPPGALLLARPGPFSLPRILRALRRLRGSGAIPLQSRRALLDACDQWRTLQRCNGAGLPTPHSTLLRRPRDPDRFGVPGPPWFLKARLGSKGSHVFLAADSERAGAVARFLWGLGLSAIVQEDLRARGPVHRFLVGAGEVLACAEARPRSGEYRSNWHCGGSWLPHPPPTVPEGAALARRTAALLDLRLAAVDLLGDPPVVLEVNASPGLEGLELATGRNLAADVVHALVSSAPADRDTLG